jgi:hypothetical protein
MRRVWWHLSDYISHRRAGEAYRRCLALAGFEVVDRPEDADLVVLHEDPDELAPIFWTDFPGLREQNPR